MLLFPKAAIISSTHLVGETTQVNYLLEVRSPRQISLGLTSRSPQAMFLSEDSIHLLAHAVGWQNSVPSGWRTVGLLSGEGHSKV